MPETPIPGRGYGAPAQIPPLGAPALHAYRASLGAFGPSIVPPTTNPGCTPGRTHPLKILATPMRSACALNGSLIKMSIILQSGQ